MKIGQAVRVKSNHPCHVTYRGQRGVIAFELPADPGKRLYVVNFGGERNIQCFAHELRMES